VQVDLPRTHPRAGVGLARTKLPSELHVGWAEHTEFMNHLAADGFVVAGGPLGDGSRVLFMVRAPPEEEIPECLAADPWTGTGHLVISTIEPWEIVVGGLPVELAPPTAGASDADRS